MHGSFYVTKQKTTNKGKDRCFLSVLLCNYRNNGRFPFQLIILLVSRPHSTRTGRDNLIVGIVFKCTQWWSNYHFVFGQTLRIELLKLSSLWSLSWCIHSIIWSLLSLSSFISVFSWFMLIVLHLTTLSCSFFFLPSPSLPVASLIQLIPSTPFLLSVFFACSNLFTCPHINIIHNFIFFMAVSDSSWHLFS